MSKTNPLGVPIAVGEHTELSKPVQIVPSIPDPSHHKALRSALRKRGMSDRVAGAVSTIWTNPEAVLPQISNPQRRRVPGAYLLVVSGQVYTARLAADPMNPRNADAVPFALAGDRAAPPASLVAAAEIGEGEMSIHVDSRKSLLEQLDWAMETTRDGNEPKPDIGEQGIMDPPIGVATTVFYDGTDESPTTHIFVREGSTRVCHGQNFLGVDAEDVLFRLPRSASPMQTHIDKINSYVAMPADVIGKTQMAAVRCAVTEFELIIGVVPDTPGAAGLSQAIKARVAQDHLNTKTPWSDAAKNTTLAEECLISVREAGIVSDAEADWLGGRLTVEQAADRKITPFSDDRAAKALHLFTTSDYEIHQAVRRPIALVLTTEPVTGRRKQAQVRTTTKLPLAVELISREMRGLVASAELTRFRKNLTEALPGDLQKREWRPTDRSPEDLFQAALQELKNDATGGPAGTELWVRAAYVLVKHRMITGGRHDLGGGGDRRTSGEVMEALLETEAGLRHLRQAVEDDRAGQLPRQIDTEGTPRHNAAGGDMAITPEYLRVTLAPVNGDPLPPLPPDQAAQVKYNHQKKALKEMLRNIEFAMRDLEAIKDDNDVPLIVQQGRVDATLFKNKLEGLFGDATRWWVAAIEAQAQTAGENTDGEEAPW